MLVLLHPSPDEVAADLVEACQYEQPADDEQPLHSAPPACSAHGMRVWATRGASSDSILRMGKRGGVLVSEENKAMVQRLVEGINAGDIEGTVDELFAPQAARQVKRLFTEFYKAFPDWREEIVELVAEGNTVAGRFKCSSTLRRAPGRGPHEQAHGGGGGLLPTRRGREVRGLLGARGQPGQDATTGSPTIETPNFLEYLSCMQSWEQRTSAKPLGQRQLHSPRFTSQPGTEPWLRVCVVSER